MLIELLPQLTILKPIMNHIETRFVLPSMMIVYYFYLHSSNGENDRLHGRIHFHTSLLEFGPSTVHMLPVWRYLRAARNI